MTPIENSHRIAAKVADLMKVQLDDNQILTSHTLKTHSNNHVDQSKQKMHPPFKVIKFFKSR